MSNHNIGFDVQFMIICILVLDSPLLNQGLLEEERFASYKMYPSQNMDLL